MINIVFIENHLIIDSIIYDINQLIKETETSVNVFVSNDIYSTVYTLFANEILINGILQTSADMIIETLSNGQA